MSELQDVEFMIEGVINNYKGDDIDELYEDALYEVCSDGVCGNLDCKFCPLDSLEAFERKYGKEI